MSARHETYRVPRELWDMLRRDRKWWLAPVLLVILLLGTLFLLSGSALSPLLYTLF